MSAWHAQAGDDPKVAGLVYVAAYAPEVGQSANDASSPFGWTEGQKQIRLDNEKFATVTSQGMLQYICHMVILEEPAKVAAVIDQAAKEALSKASGVSRVPVV